MEESELNNLPTLPVPASPWDPTVRYASSEMAEAGSGETVPSPRPVSVSPRAWQPPGVEELQKKLPQYQILSFIARGGMGAVYKGVQPSLKRTVAVKILPPEMHDVDLQFAARFKHEAQAMAQLSHPGIVAVYDAGETDDGMLYFVMEYVEGTDLAKIIASEGKLEPQRAVAITAAVCDALSFAHESGIIHRDIKPSNIMLDKRGRVKVADFGLAKATHTEFSALTQSSVAMGTPDFLAPEALAPGMVVDQRADVYAVGVMLYQMLTGQIPRGRFALPSGVVPQVDSRLDDIVDKAMQTDREHRYSTANQLKSDVERIIASFSQLEGDPVSTPGLRTADAPRGAEARPQQPAKQQPAASPEPARRGFGSVLFASIVGLLLVGGILASLKWFFDHAQQTNAQTRQDTPKAAAQPKKPEPPPAPAQPTPAQTAQTTPKPPPPAVPSPPATATTAPVAGTPASPTPAADKPAPPPLTPTPAATWKRVEITAKDAPDPANVKFGGNGEFALDRGDVVVSAIQGVNIAVRGRVLLRPGATNTLVALRSRHPVLSGVNLSINRKSVQVRVAEANTFEPLSTLPEDKLPAFADWVPFEFALIGGKAFATINGVPLPTPGPVTQLKPGTLFLYSTDASFKDLEVLTLDGLPEADAISSLGFKTAN